MLQVINGPVIEAGESLSDAVDCSAGELVRITMPSDWTAAPLTFQFSSDGVEFNEMCGLDGYAVTIPNIWPGSGVIIPDTVGKAVTFIKFRSGSSGNPVVQEERRQFAVAIATTGTQTFKMSSPKKKAPAKKAAKKKR
jgi:hypothetical protein